jgi:hypothetical protein
MRAVENNKQMAGMQIVVRKIKIQSLSFWQQVEQNKFHFILDLLYFNLKAYLKH